MNSEKRQLKLKCMYTKHLVKKRKSWNDGFLKVSWTGNSAICTLVDSSDIRQINLESRMLDLSELALINKGDEFTLDLENYLVQIDVQPANIPVCQPMLKLPKFVTPTTVARKVTPLQTQMQIQHLSVPATAPAFTSGAYKVSVDELDDIWGNSQSQPHVSTFVGGLKNPRTDVLEPTRNSSDSFNPHKIQRASNGTHNSAAIKLCAVDKMGSVYENRYKPSIRIEQPSLISSENWSRDCPDRKHPQITITSSSGLVSRNPTNTSEFINSSHSENLNNNVWKENNGPLDSKSSCGNFEINASGNGNWSHQQEIPSTIQSIAPVTSIDSSIWDDF